MSELTRALFSTEENVSPSVLRRIILTLMLEVEALRTAVIQLSQQQAASNGQPTMGSVLDDDLPGNPGEHSAYGSAYRDVAMLTHNSAGPTSGWEKLVARFFDPKDSPEKWPELQMLRRLGYSTEQIAQYQRAAQESETWS